MSEGKCSNTGLDPFKCGCLDCFPSIHRFKFMGLEAECKSIEDIIEAIQTQIDYFTHLKENGYGLGGDIHGDHLEIYPPKREGFYWGRCRNCGYHIELPLRGQQPTSCENCKGVVQDE